ncbi:MAG: biopolymer transporter ExbD [Deltaproteobacteria bacterium]|jgi:biopolymer transport protein ExbD|nr:biopolymer transporter ExbD [Deltaproteobacteria bacterium]
MNPLSWEEDPDVSLDMTPLIDAVFMLLIFFIMATTFSRPVLEVALAGAESAAIADRDKKELDVSITEDGRIFFDGLAVSPEDLTASLASWPPETVIVFNVDKKAPFGLFIRALDAAKGQGRADFIINVSRERGQEDHEQPVASK